mgnify:CR=1 FL=1|tara:strand:- start:569 stop:922 length:354 start_codon:yes stop_codon:yes gene_type:complete
MTCFLHYDDCDGVGAFLVHAYCGDLVFIALAKFRLMLCVQILSVALHDIGQFVRYHPGGRNVIGALPQAKIAIMSKLNHADAEVSLQFVYYFIFSLQTQTCHHYHSKSEMMDHVGCC